MDPKVLGITAALLSAASWALGAILFKRLGERLSSLAMTLVKGALSIVLLATVMAVCEVLSRLGLQDYVTGFETIGWQPLVILALSGILGIAIADTCFFEALKDLGPHSLLLLQSLGLILTPLGAIVFLGESRTPVEWLGIGLIVAGVTFVLYVNLSGEKGGAGWRGLLFGLLSVVCMSASFIIAKRPLETVSAIEATLIRMAAGTLGLLLLGLVTRRLGAWVVPLSDARLAGRFLAAVCVITFGGFWLSLLAMKHLDVSVATPLISTEPLFVLPLAAIMLKEKITWRAVAGTVVTILGIGLLWGGAASELPSASAFNQAARPEQETRREGETAEPAVSSAAAPMAPADRTSADAATERPQPPDPEVAFAQLDTNQDDKLDWEEFALSAVPPAPPQEEDRPVEPETSAARALWNLPARLFKRTPPDPKTIFRELDANRDGQLSRTEFIQGVKRLPPPPPPPEFGPPDPPDPSG